VNLLFKRLLAFAVILFLAWFTFDSPYRLLLSGRAIAIAILVFTAVSSGIIGVQMRRKVRRDLGRKATEEDLTSLDTWMKVDEVEEEKQRNDPPK